MSSDVNITNSREALERFARQAGQESREVSAVASPGARAAAWTVKVKSNSSYNVYNVRAVVLGDAGSLPVEIGQQVQAVNLAESFTQTGQLSAGTYAVMFRVGEKYVFYVPA